MEGHVPGAASGSARAEGTSVKPQLADGRRHLQGARPVEALACADAVLEGDPHSVDGLELRMDSLLAIGQFETAIALAHRILSARPANVRAREALAAYEPSMIAPDDLQRQRSVRPYRSDIPRELLLRIQQVVHHYTYAGVQMVKNPFDFALYQLLLWRVQPRTIFEVGSKQGGSALYFADQLGNFGVDVHVHSYDVIEVTDVAHERVTFHFGDGRALQDSISSEFIRGCARPFLVVEDADHTYETSLAVVRFFHPFLEPGDWMVVEDGNLSDLYPDLYPDNSSGPNSALREFLADNEGHYRIAQELCDLFGYNATANINGYLERI